MKKDKLDRWRNTATAVATLNAKVPFWVTLTPAERSGKRGINLQAWFIQNGFDRRAFRDFVRSMCK